MLYMFKIELPTMAGFIWACQNSLNPLESNSTDKEFVLGWTDLNKGL